MSDSGTTEAVVIIGNAPFDGVPLVGRWLADNLSRDRPVLFVDPPVSPATARRYPELAASIKPPRLRKIREGLWRLTPLVLPLKDRRQMMPVTGYLMGSQVRRAVKRLEVSVAATLIIAPHRQLFGYAGERVKVYLAADDYPAGAELMSLPKERIAELEERIASQADYVVVSSPTNQQRWIGKGFDALFLPHGVDVEALAAVDTAPAPDGWNLEPPVATLMGHISPRVDLTLLEAVADSGVNVLIIGPSRFHDDSLEKLTRHPRIHWIGFRPFSELPRYLGVTNVGLVPYAQIEFNRASFPLKTLEYLAAGLPVVSTDLPSVRWLDAPDVTIADGRTSYANAVTAAAAVSRDPTLVARRRQFASGHSWRARTAQLSKMIGID